MEKDVLITYNYFTCKNIKCKMTKKHKTITLHKHVLIKYNSLLSIKNTGSVSF